MGADDLAEIGEVVATAVLPGVLKAFLLGDAGESPCDERGGDAKKGDKNSGDEVAGARCRPWRDSIRLAERGAIV